jgi:DNA-binding response OmpR family regulator
MQEAAKTIIEADMLRKILVADDEPKIVKLVSVYLEAAGFSVIPAKDGEDAVAKFRSEGPDCAILDINMPGADGLETAGAIRKFSDAPIIFLTARTEETDRIVGLEIGADDYVVKPFSPRELVARVKAVLRRSNRAGASPEAPGVQRILRQGDVTLDPVKHIVTIRGERKDLTSVQFAILKTLLLEPGRVFSRLSLLEAVMGSTFEGYERTIDAHIKNIRKALGDDGDAPKYIGTVRGVGYKFIDRCHED